MNRNLLLVALLLSTSGCGGAVEQTGSPDAAGDSASDTAKTETGTPLETGADTPADTVVPTPDVAPFDATPPDSGVPLVSACSAAGGVVCTDHRWTLCPTGFEPIATGDGHLGCGGGGWCCVPAPPSTCSASGKGNCIVGECKGCWFKVPEPSLTCESGRSCCEDMCD